MLKVPLDLVTDFKNGLMKIKSQMDILKHSLDPFGMYFMVKLNSILPPVLQKLATSEQTAKLTCVFTNVPGPKTPLIFSGLKCKKIMFFVPALGNLACGISIVSHVDTITVGCISDES